MIICSSLVFIIYLAVDTARSGLPKPEIVPSVSKIVWFCPDRTKAFGPDGLNLTTLIIDTTFPKHATWHIFFRRLSISSLSPPYGMWTDSLLFPDDQSTTNSINDYFYHPLLIFIWSIQFHGSSSPRNRRTTGRYLQRILAAMLCGFGYRVSLKY